MIRNLGGKVQFIDDYFHPLCGSIRIIIEDVNKITCAILLGRLELARKLLLDCVVWSCPIEHDFYHEKYAL